ncbi:hypothetical protein [Dactylosporangium darangshiense]|uniref:hypothetical protein n=1 Tax=Dactylosporangium darangshiense TaxID=579108 RepID=UPI00362FE27B
MDSEPASMPRLTTSGLSPVIFEIAVGVAPASFARNSARACSVVVKFLRYTFSKIMSRKSLASGPAGTMMQGTCGRPVIWAARRRR